MTKGMPPVLGYAPPGKRKARPVSWWTSAAVLLPMLALLLLNGSPVDLLVSPPVTLDNRFPMLAAIALKSIPNVLGAILGLGCAIMGLRNTRRSRELTGGWVAMLGGFVNTIWLVETLLAVHNFYHVFYRWL